MIRQMQYFMKFTHYEQSILFFQSISPGVVETEFAPRLYHDNAEKAAASYTKFKVKI